MKLFIQIPCLNEESTLPKVLGAIPKKIPGISKIQVLIIDDGSTDDTVKVAIENGVDFIVQHHQNRGLAESFTTGLDYCFRLGADIVVNTDGDNQYKGENIIDLVAPLVQGRADMIIGYRDMSKISDFSFIKKILQKLGSYIVSLSAGVKVADATSGFRAFNKRVGNSFFINQRFTYTLETVIQASRKNFRVYSVPIEVNPMERKSRLSRNITHYVRRSALDIILITPSYNPMKFFSTIGLISLTAGSMLGARFIYFLSQYNGDFGSGSGYVQSLILAAIFLLFGSFSILAGFIAEQIARNRNMLEELIYQDRLSSIRNQNENSNLEMLLYSKNKSVDAD